MFALHGFDVVGLQVSKRRGALTEAHIVFELKEPSAYKLRNGKGISRTAALAKLWSSQRTSSSASGMTD